MGIWCYQDAGVFGRDVYLSTECVYCGTRLTVLVDERESGAPGCESCRHLRACRSCGWWTGISTGSDNSEHGCSNWTSVGSAVLRELDVSSGDAQCTEVRDYLNAKYDARGRVHPRVMEDVVATAYADIGYRTVTTSYARDDGIDIFIERNGIVSGVQVKRTRNKIEAEQIRALTGAMVLNGVTRGVFVTTSTYRRGAVKAARRYAEAGLQIDLVDCDSLFELLRQRRHSDDVLAGIHQNECWRHLKSLYSFSNHEGFGDGPYDEGDRSLYVPPDQIPR